MMEKALSLFEVASGFRFQVRYKTMPLWVSRLWQEKPQKYSKALLETLSIIAYQQPITRGEIESIRGVGVSSSIIHTLIDRLWIRSVWAQRGAWSTRTFCHYQSFFGSL